MTPANENILLCDACPDLGDLMDLRVRDVFDVRGQCPELEDSVRQVGIGYSSPERRPTANGRTMAQEALDASRYYKVAVIL